MPQGWYGTDLRSSVETIQTGLSFHTVRRVTPTPEHRLEACVTFGGRYLVFIIPPIGPWPSHFSGRFQGMLLTRLGSEGWESVAQPVIKNELAAIRTRRKKRMAQYLLGPAKNHHVSGFHGSSLRTGPANDVRNGRGRFHRGDAEFGDHAGATLYNESRIHGHALAISNAEDLSLIHI